MSICSQCQTSFEISEKERAFCENMGIPLSDICPRDRLRQVMATRNEWKLYHRKCDSSGKDIISAYPAEASFPVYTNEIWWGDSWDAKDYGRDYDFDRPFFDQFADLRRIVPREGTSIVNCENCAYNSHIRDSKNCYLNSLVSRCENLYYSYWTVGSKDVYDSMILGTS